MGVEYCIEWVVMQDRVLAVEVVRYQLSAQIT